MVKQIAKLLLSGILVAGALNQVQGPEMYVERGRQAGLPANPNLIRANGIAMILAVVGLFIPPLRRISALALAMQLPVITWVGHRFWELEAGPQRANHRMHFFKNLGLIGGLLYIASDR